MSGHRERLTAIAAEHGLPPLTGDLSPGVYMMYAADLALLALGLLKPEEIEAPKRPEPQPKQWSILPW